MASLIGRTFSAGAAPAISGTRCTIGRRRVPPWKPARQLFRLGSVAAGLFALGAVWAQPTAPDFSARLDNNILCVVEPSLEVNVGTPVDGVIEIVNVDRGDIVTSGQLLARLAAGVETAAVDYQAAKAEYGARRFERNQAMQGKQLISAQELDEIATDQRLAELELKEREERLRLRSIVSPIAGVIVDRYRHKGDLVKQERIFRIAQLDPLHIETVVPARYFGRIKPGQVFDVKPQFSAASIKAKVGTVDRVIDQASNTFRVRLLLPNPKFEIPSGQRCTLNFNRR